jgi:O-antigen/teichoic acid export membrane protein
LAWTATINIILNIILIPLLGVWGAALASLICTILLFILNGFVARQVISLSKTHLKQITNI